MAIVIPAEAGRLLPGDFEVLIKVRSEDTDGVMAVVEETVPPRRLISPHTHENDVWVYVLDGQIGVLVGDDTQMAARGRWALKPRNVVHAMWNATDEPARIIEVLTPGGTERWFEGLARLEGGDSEGWDRLCRLYKIDFLEDSSWTEELRKRYGLL